MCALVMSVHAFSDEVDVKKQQIFEADIIHAPDSMKRLEKAASFIISKQESKMTSQELLEKFKEFASSPEGQELILPVYERQLGSESFDAALELFSNDQYMKYREPLTKAHKRALKRCKRIMNEIAKGNEVIALQSIEDDIDLDESPIVKGETVLELTKENAKSILSNHLVILDVYTDWCGPCKALSKVFKELSVEQGDQYTFAKMNAEVQYALAEEFHITAYPTIIFFIDGKEVGRHLGYMNKNQFLEVIHKHFK